MGAGGVRGRQRAPRPPAVRRTRQRGGGQLVSSFCLRLPACAVTCTLVYLMMPPAIIALEAAMMQHVHQCMCKGFTACHACSRVRVQNPFCPNKAPRLFPGLQRTNQVHGLSFACQFKLLVCTPVHHSLSHPQTTECNDVDEHPRRAALCGWHSSAGPSCGWVPPCSGPGRAGREQGLIPGVRLGLSCDLSCTQLSRGCCVLSWFRLVI